MVTRTAIIEGTTAPIQFQLLEAGAPIPLSGITVTILIANRFGTVLTTTNTVAVVSAAAGTVSFTAPDATFFVPANGPYYVRWVLTDSNNLISYVPLDTRDVWHILAR